MTRMNVCVLAGMAVLAAGCAGPSAMPIRGGASAGLLNAAADDGTITQDIAEGGVPNQAYVLDGTVRAVFSRSLIIESELGSRQLWITSATHLTVDGEEGTLDQVKPGARIRAEYGVTHLARDLDVGPEATQD